MNKPRLYNCPYHLTEKQLMLRCEGIENISALHITFDSTKERNKFAVKYCANPKSIFAFEECPFYKIINEYVEGCINEQT